MSFYSKIVLILNKSFVICGKKRFKEKFILGVIPLKSIIQVFSLLYYPLSDLGKCELSKNRLYKHPSGMVSIYLVLPQSRRLD